MSISNKTKRRLTCQFCPKQRKGCKCNKYWKEVYHKHREEILKIYHETSKKT